MKTFTQKINESVGYIEPALKQIIIDKLCNAYKEEIAAFYYYNTVAEFLCGPSRKCAEEFFEKAAEDELMDHGKWILQRISQLGGCPSCVTVFADVHNAVHQYINPVIVNNAVNVINALNNCKQMELDAISTYRELEETTRNIDVVSNRKIKEILADEEEHLQEIEDFICDITNNAEAIPELPCACDDDCCCDKCDDCCCDDDNCTCCKCDKDTKKICKDIESDINNILGSI